MKCSVIIPCWVLNNEIYELTNNTLTAFGESDWDRKEIELVLVDNGSPLGGDQLMKVADTYVRNRVNLGYPKAVNQGIKLSKGNLLCIANNDIRVSPNWLKAAEEIFKKLPKAGTVHFKMIGYDDPFDLSDGVWEKGKEKWCHGSFYLIKREVIDKIGIYDERFGLGGVDDWDFFHRIREAGFSTVYTNGVAFQHKDSSTMQLRDRREYSESDKRNAALFKKKWGKEMEELFYSQFPEQKDVPWKPFP